MRTTHKIKAAFFSGPADWLPISPIDYTYGNGRRAQLAALCDLYPRTVTAENLAGMVPELSELEVIFSTWGMPCLTETQLEFFPKLRVLFYAAGSVSHFAAPFLKRGIQIVSAKEANADSVAEFCLGQILLGTKGYFRNSREYRAPEAWPSCHRGPGNYAETVALIGVGAVARKTAALLRHFKLKLLLVEDYLSEAEAHALGGTKVSLEEAFTSAFVVSNHLADFPHTRGAIRTHHFLSMRPGAVFLNTGRGPQVDEAGLVEALARRPDLTALLDVTEAEPLPSGSPLYALPNVHLSTHLAGAMNNEAARLADLVIDEFIAYRDGQPLRHSVAPGSLTQRA
ncbi:MAG: hydroxyacid dehydrogenase [Opitutae bacterium]|nr:hydroxyacid dehydrogenase [Opitutae bacterium]